MPMELPRLPKVSRFLRRPRAGSGDFTWDLEEYVPGNRLQLYVRGHELYPAMAAAIEEARSTVHLETYIFGSDKVGRLFIDLLSQKARQGVRVRLIYDSVGCIDLDPELVTRLRNSGAQLLEYHPVAPWRPRWAWNRRDHRKLLVCDGRVGFVGGMNICDEHAPREEGGQDWPDAHARVEGPAAYDLDRLFRSVWFSETGRWFDSEGDPGAQEKGALVKIAANSEFLNRFAIREAYAHALTAARERVDIANSYFVPDWRVRRALGGAARRGAAVRILVPGKPDIWSVWHAMRSTYSSLLARGVRIFEWQGPMMHAKAVCVDRQWCSLGSYNLDHRSLRHNLEVNLHALDGPFAERLSAAFEAGIKGSREITLESWRARPWKDRLLEEFWASFDYFL